MSQRHDDSVTWTIGRYTLFGEIAAGGMATVHFGRLAASAGFSKTVAIKRLHPQFAKDPDFRDMFVDEARLASRIRHPNVVQPLDVVATEGELFLVMEYIHGEALSRLMKELRNQNEPISPKIAAAVMVNVLHGLHAAHEAKTDQGQPLDIIHRDVSPQNFLVGVDGIARVIDFGIAKAANQTHLTREGEVRGKLPYLAPEQFGSEPPDRRVDIYSAAVVLWEMLAGKRLFEADEQAAMYAQIIAGAKSPPSAFARDVTPELDAVVMRGLARNPNTRFPTAREMALQLEETMSLATASQVGAWVERIAHKSLAARAKRLATVESAPSAPVLEDASATPSGPRSGVGSRRGQAPLSGRASAPPPVSRPPPRSGTPPRSSLPPPDIDPLAPSPPTPPTPSPEDQARRAMEEAPTVAHPGSTPAPKRGRTLDVVFVFAVLLLLGVGAYAALPWLVKSSLSSRAAAQGLTLTIGDVKISLHELRLKNVELRATDLPGVTLTARSVELGLRELQIESISSSNAELAVEGSWPSVVENVQHFHTKHPMDVDPVMHLITAEDMRITWSRPFGERTTLVAENVHLDVERHEPHALGEDLGLSVAILKLETPGGRLGPWSATIDRDPDNLHGRLALEPTGAAVVQGVLARNGTGHVQLDTPPIPLASLGVPTTLASALKIAGTAHYSVPAKDTLDAKIDLTFSGLRIPGAAQAADLVRLEGEVAGDARKALPVQNGAVTIGPSRAGVAGTVDVGSGALKVDVAFRSSPRPCEAIAGEREQIAGQLVFDTRHLDEIVVSAGSLGRCPIRYLPPRASP